MMCAKETAPVPSDSARLPAYRSNSREYLMSPLTSGEIVISDVTGKKVFEGKIERGNSEFVLETIPAGLYIYHISDNNSGNSCTGKFIVE